MRAEFTHKWVNDVLVLRDKNKGALSITNDAEAVVEHCITVLGAKPQTLIVYRDTRGIYDQLVHDGAKFIDFKSLNTIYENDAVVLLQDPKFDSGGDFWKFHKLHSQQHRAEKREEGPKLLKEYGVEFVVKNNGAHILIGKPVVANFWPGTGRWTSADNSNNGQGINGMIAWLKKNHPTILKGKQA